MGYAVAVTKTELAGAAPFRSASEAWFWAVTCLRARHDGERSHGGAGIFKRPCDPDDVLRCLERLYRARRIDDRHTRVLSRWGERQRVPDPDVALAGERGLWHEALNQLEAPLRSKGIVS